MWCLLRAPGLCALEDGTKGTNAWWVEKAMLGASAWLAVLNGHREERYDCWRKGALFLNRRPRYLFPQTKLESMQRIPTLGEYLRGTKKPLNEVGFQKLKGCRKGRSRKWRWGMTCIKGTAATGQSQISEKYGKCPMSSRWPFLFSPSRRHLNQITDSMTKKAFPYLPLPLFLYFMTPQSGFKPIARSGGEEEARKSQRHLRHLSSTSTDIKHIPSCPRLPQLTTQVWEGRRERSSGLN